LSGTSPQPHQLVYTAYGIIALHGTAAGGNGADAADITLARAVISLRAWYLCEVLYNPISAAIRTSVAVFLLRVVVARTHKIIIWVNMVVIWVTSLAFFLILLLQCQPLDHFWLQITGQPGTCVDPSIVGHATIVHSTVAACSDWVLGLLPIAILWDVKLNKRTKAMISFLLGLGIL